jgi:hypothetical protein
VAPSRNGNSGIGRIVPVGLAALLLIGILGSIVMGIRARNAAIASTENQAGAIASSSLTLVLRPDDLDAVATGLRIPNLTDQIGTVVVEPSDFDAVTLWSPEGTILYSTDEGRIGNQLDGERERIKEALRGKPQSVIADGKISVMVPLEFDSGVGEPAVVELTRSDAPVATASGPWRTSAIFIAVALVVVLGLLLWSRFAAESPEQHLVMRRAEERSNAPAPTQPSTAPRTISVPHVGMKEEADARRMAEDRARAAEERLGVLQEQYRKTLEELQVAHRQAQQSTGRPDPRLEERAMQAESRARQLEEHARTAEERARGLEERSRELEDRAQLFERQAASTQAELEEMGRRTAERAQQEDARDGDGRTHQAEQEVIGLRAELEGLQTQLSMARRELESSRSQADRARGLRGDLDSVNVEAVRAREAAESAQAELQSRSKELDDLRNEVRALRTEEQRAAMLEDELRASRAELQSVGASHRAELIEREADLEEKVRAMREEFQGELSRLESQYREQMAQRELRLTERVSGAEDAAAQRLDTAERELAERAKRFERAEDDIAKATAEAQHLAGELTIAQAELETTVAQLESESERALSAEERLAQLEGSSHDSDATAQRVAADLNAAALENADLNRRLQEIEARRALEIADAEGRADLDDILRVTQERLAGQTEKLIATEERAQKVERQLQASAERLEEVEAELRHQQMAQAMREIRGEVHDGTDQVTAGGSGEPAEHASYEDRRAASPFMKELSLDAKKSLTRILGITQILKYKKDAKEQTQLVRQLTAHTRRLDHIVADLADADRLAHGTVELTVRRTDLEPLIQRVVEESGLEADHELLVHLERLVVAVDPLRTEQIVSGLLRVSGDRTPPKKAITVRLLPGEGGALILVEDPEPSSDGSMSPVVRRFAEVQGGWAKVESRESGGSVFSVFLPDGAGLGETPGGPGTEREVKVVVDEPTEPWEAHDEKAMVDELHRLSTAED